MISFIIHKKRFKLREVLKTFSKLAILAFMLVQLCACMQSRPSNVDNICQIFRQYPDWYWDTEDVQTRWKVPISVQMAIIHQESRFHPVAKPPRTKLLWVIPWKRPSSAYGYTQALDGTWKAYVRQSGNYLASRSSFKDSVDFVGWYGYQAHRKAGISRDDPYRLYLSYHEGVGGYQRKTYLSKPWLVKVAKKVSWQSNKYKKQLAVCEPSLRKKPWYRFW